ncbi:hypothetical protein LAD12857_13850 [Lacrimispora amygdalina]|uniref:Uncharacterized protein n=1 Tax=Lacrimispora amygdalina TaxID=253257 RepID=A0A3E2NAQ2_9FIRM|nr:hypothetical protein DS742_15240 [Clostridium indicum]
MFHFDSCLISVSKIERKIEGLNENRESQLVKGERFEAITTFLNEISVLNKAKKVVLKNTFNGKIEGDFKM